jgi:hypothetical protein
VGGTAWRRVSHALRRATFTGVSVIDRYRRWNRLAYLSPRERGLNRALWGLLLIALVYAGLHHVYLVNEPALVSWGPPFGVICYDLAIAYAGAFMFYVLVVRLSLRRDRQNIYRHVGPLVGLIVTQGNQLMTTLNKAAEITPPNRENTWENIEEMCSKVSLNTDAEGLFIGTEGIGKHTVFTVIVDNMNRTRSWIERILSFSSFLATDLVELLSAFETHSHFRTFSEFVSILKAGASIDNPDVSLWAHEIFNYATLIRQLESYGQKYLPMTYEDRPGLMTATSYQPSAQPAESR